MTRAAGVVFEDTKPGTLDRNKIPTDTFQDHYLMDASTPGQSSFPVVDGDGYLRRGNVLQAYRQADESGRADRVRRYAAWLGRYFEDDPLPDVEEPDINLNTETSTVTDIDVDADLSFDAQPAEGLDFNQFSDRVGDGFSEHGVRENYDDEGDLQSVDVLYEAMEPGPPEERNGVRITESFLENVGGKDYSGQPPFMLDHEKATFSKIGNVRQAWFSHQVGKLMLMNRIPNTGGATHDEAIARYTHEPPSIRNGSVGFGRNYTAKRNEEGEPELQDATLQEFSTTPFPGGYDDGGLARAFADAAQEAANFDDPADDDCESGENLAAFGIKTDTITFD